MSGIVPIRDVWENPYSEYMSPRLSDRCDTIRLKYCNGHYADLRGELELMRATAIDILDMYRISELETDELKRSSMALQAGICLRKVLNEIAAMAMAAMRIDEMLGEVAAPQITRTIEIARDIAREHNSETFDPQKFIQQLVSEVDNGNVSYTRGAVGSSLGRGNADMGTSGITPDLVVAAMDNSVPASA